MRLRKLELIFVGITLAFVFFIGGFFTGRSYTPVNIESVGTMQIETANATEAAVIQQLPQENNTSTLPQNTNTNTGAYQETNTDLNAGTGINQDNTEQSVVEPGAPRVGDGRININTASKNELMDLPGIGPALAENIIQYRNSNGPFNTIEDIMNVSGIAEGRFSRIRDRITV